MNVIFASYGNDSMALIQWAHINRLKDVHVLYSDTGWAADWWKERVKQGERFAIDCGFDVHRTKSEGMESLVKRKKGWPQGGAAAFCTRELKINPALEWLDENDPEKEATCLIGVRRAESANRSDHPEHIEESENHGGRQLWAPLVRHTDEMRNELLTEAGFDVLPHRSKECFPCVHANRKDLQMLDEKRISMIEQIETEMGFTKNDKPRVMFRPKRHQGAVGIRQVVNWANNTHEDQLDLFPCSSGYCGM